MNLKFTAIESGSARLIAARACYVAMKGTRRTVSTMALLIALGGLALTALPVAFANPINANLNWSPQPVSSGSTTTATYGVAIDADCPSGQTFSGTVTVVEPDGVSTATVTVASIPCGAILSSVYPTDFSGTASTSQLGTYTATWAGASSASVGGAHPTFRVTNAFVVYQFPPPTVPEFPVPAILVAAVGLVLLAGMRKGRILGA